MPTANVYLYFHEYCNIKKKSIYNNFLHKNTCLHNSLQFLACHLSLLLQMHQQISPTLSRGAVAAMADAVAAAVITVLEQKLVSLAPRVKDPLSSKEGFTRSCASTYFPLGPVSTFLGIKIVLKFNTTLTGI